MTAKTQENRVAIVGMGLMGASLGLALRANRLAAEVVGAESVPETLQEAERLGAFDRGVTDAREAVAEASCVILATPVPHLPGLLETLASAIPPDALITDLGSAKTRIVAMGERLYGARFVGGHPMAGAERSGPGAARSDLFRGAAWAVVRAQPFLLHEDAWAQRLAHLIEALGATPVPIDAAEHDRYVALVSHLPHLLSFALARAVATERNQAATTLAGGSFRDMTRVAYSNPALWRDILAENRAAALDALTACQIELDLLRDALDRDDRDALYALLNFDFRAPRDSATPTETEPS